MLRLAGQVDLMNLVNPELDDVSEEFLEEWLRKLICIPAWKVNNLISGLCLMQRFCIW